MSPSLSSWRFRLNSSLVGGLRISMGRYSEELKSAILKKLLPPQNRTVVAVATEEGISDATLYNWLKQGRKQGNHPVPGLSKTAEEWPGEAKLAVVIETSPLSEEERSVYCREKASMSSRLSAGETLLSRVSGPV